jgi:hypothetical protein
VVAPEIARALIHPPSGAPKAVALRDLDDPAAYADYHGRSAAATYGRTFEVVGAGYIVGLKHYPHSAFESVLAQADAHSLAAEVGDGMKICPVMDDGRLFDTVGSKWIDSYTIEVADGGVIAKVSQLFRDAAAVPEDIEDFVSNYLDDSPCQLLEIIEDADRDPHSFAWLKTDPDDNDEYRAWKEGELRDWQNSLDAEPRRAELTIGLRSGENRMFDLIEAARDISAALAAAVDLKKMNVSLVQTWFRAGRFKLMLGLAESEWLEVKSQAYGIAAPAASSAHERQKIELAQDVARFANGGVDAVLLVGYSEGMRGTERVLQRVTPTSLSSVDAVRYQTVLDARIVPAVIGLLVEVVEAEAGGSLMMITVPKQPEELQPYLVHGAILGEKVEGSFFSVVTRRGEGSITTQASQIHGYLVAGRAALRAAPELEEPDPTPKASVVPRKPFGRPKVRIFRRR